MTQIYSRTYSVVCDTSSNTEGYLPLGNIKGFLRQVKVTVPSLEGTTTATVYIGYDGDVFEIGSPIFTVGSIAENDTTVLIPSDSTAPAWEDGRTMPIVSSEMDTGNEGGVKVDLSNTQSTAQTVEVELTWEERPRLFEKRLTFGLGASDPSATVNVNDMVGILHGAWAYSADCPYLDNTLVGLTLLNNSETMAEYTGQNNESNPVMTYTNNHPYADSELVPVNSRQLTELGTNWTASLSINVSQGSAHSFTVYLWVEE